MTEKMERLGLNPWERMPGESSKAYEAFSVYRDMGPRRSQLKVAKELTKSRPYIGELSSKFDWVNRASAWDAENERLKLEAHFESIRVMREEHAELGKLMVEVAKQSFGVLLEKTGRISANAAVQIAAEGTKIERLARGDSAEVVDVRESESEAVFNPVRFYMPENGREA